MTLKTASLVAALAEGASFLMSLSRLAQISQYGSYPMVAASYLAGAVAQGALVAFLLTVYLKLANDT